MARSVPLPPAHDNLLFTPGPLTTSQTVKQAMLRDAGSRDDLFLSVVRDIRDRLLDVAGLTAPDYTAILLQGSGTFGIESVLGSVLPPDGRLLVVINGAYGRRIAQIASVLRIDHRTLVYAEQRPADVAAIADLLEQDPGISHLAVVHCETTSGLINPVAAIGELARRHGVGYIVDAMSSFGAIPIAMQMAGIDFVISSTNKCI